MKLPSVAIPFGTDGMGVRQVYTKSRGRGFTGELQFAATFNAVKTAEEDATGGATFSKKSVGR